MIKRNIIEDDYGVLYTKDEMMLVGYNPDVFKCTSYRIRDGVTRLAANAFHQCQTLKSVFMPDSVIVDDGSVFEGCKNLEEARVSANLKNPDIAMFCGCRSLHHVELPKGIVSIGENMFCGCKSLKRINLPTTITRLCGDTFCGSGIEEIVLPEDLKYIGADAFLNCYNLMELTIPPAVDFIGPWIVQGHREFQGVTCLSPMFRIEKDALIANKDDSFLSCWSKSKEYHFPASVKRVRSVSNDQIERLYVDYPLEEIGYEAFISCPSLKNIVYKAVVRTNKSADWKAM